MTGKRGWGICPGRGQYGWLLFAAAAPTEASATIQLVAWKSLR